MVLSIPSWPQGKGGASQWWWWWGGGWPRDTPAQYPGGGWERDDPSSVPAVARSRWHRSRNARNAEPPPAPRPSRGCSQRGCCRQVLAGVRRGGGVLLEYLTRTPNLPLCLPCYPLSLLGKSARMKIKRGFMRSKSNGTGKRANPA